MRDIISKLFKRENTVAVILLISAVLGLVGVPQRIGITSEQIILAFLGLLTVDTLIERLGYLNGLAADVRELRNKIEPSLSADRLFLIGSHQKPFSVWLDQADDIWVSGMALNELIRNYGEQIQAAAKARGKRFRFLVVNPDNPSLMEALANSSSLHPKAKESELNIRQAVIWMANIRSRTPRGSIEVRLVNHIPTCAIMVIDGNRKDGRILIDLYGYKVSPAERQLMQLKRSADERTFNYFLDQFNRTWNAATPVEGKSADTSAIVHEG